MRVSISKASGSGAGEPRVDLRARYVAHPGPLSHRTDLGEGVAVDVDLMSPGRWQSVSVAALDSSSSALVQALIGREATDLLETGGLSALPSWLVVDPTGADRWLRVAVVSALDRWLQLPLDQSAVDAERAVSQGRAARSLPDGDARTLILGDAVRRARRASAGVVTFLRDLARRSPSLPEALQAAVDDLVGGYEEFLGDVHGEDSDLAVVGRTWQQLSRRGPGGRTGPVSPARQARAVARRGSSRGSAIDPRLLRARVVALTEEPDGAEIGLTPAVLHGSDAVNVRIRAFDTAARDVRSMLAVRLRDGRTADVHALLAMPTSRSPYFEVTVPLGDLAARDLRVEVFDPLADPPDEPGQDGGVQDVRRAVAFLGEWRRTAAIAHVRAEKGDLVRRVRRLAGRLRRPGDSGGDPAFTGGPSAGRRTRAPPAGPRSRRRPVRRHGRHRAAAARRAGGGPPRFPLISRPGSESLLQDRGQADRALLVAGATRPGDDLSRAVAVVRDELHLAAAE